MMPRASGDAAGGDHGHLDRIHHLRHQRQGAGLRRDVVAEEHAAMAAALAPWAMIASQPRSASHLASTAVVADAITLQPAARTRASSCGVGRPKWKLTISGLNSSTMAQVVSSKGARLTAGTGFAGSTPSSA